MDYCQELVRRIFGGVETFSCEECYTLVITIKTLPRDWTEKGGEEVQAVVYRSFNHTVPLDEALSIVGREAVLYCLWDGGERNLPSTTAFCPVKDIPE